MTVAVLFTTALPSRAYDWSKTYPVQGNPELRVSTSDANIRVSTWDKSEIEARVTSSHYKIGAGGLTIEEHQSGDVVEIGVKYPHAVHVCLFCGYSSDNVEIEIHMPREGKVNLRTGDGRIELAGLKGSAELKSGDGNVEIEAVDGQLRAETSDGHIRAKGRFDALEVKTGDGRVEVVAEAGSAITTGWRLETGDGSVTLDIPEQLNADVDLHSGDGHIDLEMPVTTSGKLRENEVHGKINGGGNLLVVRTGDGSIRVGKS